MKIEVSSYRNWDKVQTVLFDVDYCRNMFKYHLTKNHHNTIKEGPDGKNFDSQPERIPEAIKQAQLMVDKVLKGETLKIQENGLVYFYKLVGI